MLVIPVEQVKAVDNGRLWIRFEDGIEGESDIRELEQLPRFAGLTHMQWIQGVYVHPWSKMISWDNELNMGPLRHPQNIQRVSSETGGSKQNKRE